MKNVLVLGASGMLGSMVVDVLSQDPEFAVSASVRTPAIRKVFEHRFPRIKWVEFGFCPSPADAAFQILEGQDWIVNAIGITKPLVRDDNAEQVETAIAVNSMLPHQLGRQAAAWGGRVLQIATDCVYSGAKGLYRESDAHDPLDVYGKTKSLGESFQSNVHHLRCSIIGPEPKEFKFLIEWFRRQPRNSQVNGFTNHTWNGVTTLQFAKLCRGIMINDVILPHIQHVVPREPLTKAAMLSVFARVYSRQDIRIQEVEAKSVTDRTLATENAELNDTLWAAAGYHQPPTVTEMIEELAGHKYNAVLGDDED
jgi:dTDP-4-dehydrorhamnose reductase